MVTLEKAGTNTYEIIIEDTLAVCRQRGSLKLVLRDYVKDTVSQHPNRLPEQIEEEYLQMVRDTVKSTLKYLDVLNKDVSFVAEKIIPYFLPNKPRSIFKEIYMEMFKIKEQDLISVAFEKITKQLENM